MLVMRLQHRTLCLLACTDLGVLHDCFTGSACAIVLRTCTRCRTAVYCSKECQRDDWKTHKKSCKPVSRPVLMLYDISPTKPLDIDEGGRLYRLAKESVAMLLTQQKFSIDTPEFVVLQERISAMMKEESIGWQNLGDYFGAAKAEYNQGLQFMGRFENYKLALHHMQLAQSMMQKWQSMQLETPCHHNLAKQAAKFIPFIHQAALDLKAFIAGKNAMDAVHEVENGAILHASEKRAVYSRILKAQQNARTAWHQVNFHTIVAKRSFGQ